MNYSSVNFSSVNIPELSNNQALGIELGIGLMVAILLSVYFYRKQAAISKNQDKILGEVNTLVNKIEGLTTEQSRIAKIIEARRQNRIRWFKRHSLELLNKVKEEYQKLLEALDKYVADESEENRKKVVSIADLALRLRVTHALEIIDRDLKIAEDYLENTWLIAKLPDTLQFIGDGFSIAKQPLIDVDNIRETVRLSVEGIDNAISEINNEKD